MFHSSVHQLSWTAAAVPLASAINNGKKEENQNDQKNKQQTQSIVEKSQKSPSVSLCSLPMLLPQVPEAVLVTRKGSPHRPKCALAQ